MPGTGPFAYGDRSHVAFAPEVTYGTPVTATKFLEIQSESVKYTEEQEFLETLNTRSIQHTHAGKRSVAGAFAGLFSYSGPLATLIKHALGSASSGAANGDGQVTHTISCAEAQLTGLTLEVARDPSLYTKSFQYPGCKVKKFALKQEIGKALMFECEIMGKGTETEITLTTPTFPTVKLAHWLHLASGTGTLTLDGAAVPARSIEFSLENPMAEDAYTLQSQTRHELVASGARKVMLAVNTFIEASDPAYALFKNKTNFATVLTWKGPVIAGSSYYELSISLPYCIATAKDFNVGGAGPIEGPITIQAIANATLNNEVTITLKNIDSAI